MPFESSAPDSPVHIRIENSESSEELSMIRAVNEAAFGGTEESDLIDKLRSGGHALVSLVAEADTRVVGHIMFSRMWIVCLARQVPAVALAPVAVLPEHQRRGIGGRLIRFGLELLRSRGEEIVIVVGHPAYYPKFGFSREKAHPLDSPFPPEAFMVLELKPDALRGIRGKVRYPAAFGI
jgi:putative acetyltransferase